MSAAHPRLASPPWLRLPRRTARLRLTVLYGGLFLLSCSALVATTYVLFERATEFRTPQLPKIPHTPAIQDLRFPPKPAVPLGQALPQLEYVQNQLAQDQQKNVMLFGPFTTRDSS